MLSSVVRNRKCSHGFFKSICKQCKQAGVRGGGSQLCKHFVRRSYCTTCSPGMQRCKLHPEKTKALCLKCAHLKGHGSSLCRCVYLRCTHAYTHSPHTYSILSLLSLCSLSLSLTNERIESALSAFDVGSGLVSFLGFKVSQRVSQYFVGLKYNMMLRVGQCFVGPTCAQFLCLHRHKSLGWWRRGCGKFRVHSAAHSLWTAELYAVSTLLTFLCDCVCFQVCAEHMLSSVVRRKCSHGFFKSICKQCKQLLCFQIIIISIQWIQHQNIRIFRDLDPRCRFVVQFTNLLAHIWLQRAITPTFSW